MRWASLGRLDRAMAQRSFGVLVLMMAAHAMTETARDTLFLSGMAAEKLPYAYLGVATASWGILRWYGRPRGRTLDHRRRLSRTLAAIGVGELLVYFALPHTGRAGLFGLYVFAGVAATVSTVQLWLLLEDAFDVARAKRIFGPVAAGGIAGAIAGSLIVTVLIAVAPPSALLPAASVSWFGAAVLAAFLPRMSRGAPHAPEPTISVTPSEEALAARYLAHLLALVVLSAVVYTAVDYIFKVEVAHAVPEARLGTFFAWFYAALNATSLVVQVFGSVALFGRLGVSRGLAVVPLGLLLGAIAFALSPWLVPALLLRSVDGAMRHSVHRTGIELLYLPLSSERRIRFKAHVDGLGQRSGQALGSLAVLGTTAAGLGTGAIGLALAVLAAAWLALLSRIQALYVGLFRARLDDVGVLDPPPAVEPDERARAKLVAKLRARYGDAALEPVWAGLESAQAEVRAAALEVLDDVLPPDERRAVAVLVSPPSRR